MKSSIDVYKFGGVAIGTAEAIRIALGHVRRTPRLTVIVSAMDGVTDLLVGAGNAALRSDREACERAARAFEERHSALLPELIADRKRRAYVRALKKIAARYKHARRIHLVQDNLNTHFRESAIEVLGPLQGRRLWSRFEVHYTPKHTSWLDAAELEASLVSRQCLGRERISSLVDLISLVSAWRCSAEKEGRTIDWTFTVNDARRKFRYDGLVTARSRH